MEQQRRVKVGDPVVFVDQRATQRAAVCTANWGGDIPHPSINVVFVSGDESKTDQYGRQIQRETSVPHAVNQAAPGYYWRHADEEPKQTERSA